MIFNYYLDEFQASNCQLIFMLYSFASFRLKRLKEFDSGLFE
jgi:hypothetical protein